MPSISLSVHNVFLDAKREWACSSVHFTEDHNLVETMKDRFSFRHATAVMWNTWRCDCLGLVLELLLPIKVLMKVPIRKPLQVNAQKIAFNRPTRDFFFLVPLGAIESKFLILEMKGYFEAIFLTH